MVERLTDGGCTNELPQLEGTWERTREPDSERSYRKRPWLVGPYSHDTHCRVTSEKVKIVWGFILK